MTSLATPAESAPLAATATLATYAAALRFEDLPAAVISRAREALVDTIAISLRGSDTPWSRIVVDFVSREGCDGDSRIIGVETLRSRAESAALANGVLAHALELDSLRKPGAGVHPGAIVPPAALAVAQEVRATGKDLLTAIVAGCEVLLRIGVATRHTAEPRGFHAPGLTGPFGATAAAGRLFGLDADQMTMAFGIAGSTSSGLMQFAAEAQGAMVKRLHIGRAAQNGVLAARLAGSGFTGPRQILEGAKGFLQTYCGEFNVGALTAGLGIDYEILNLCVKRYPCHITAHTAVYAIECLRRDVALAAGNVEAITVIGTDRMAELNGDRDPKDPALAKYSIPFCIAAALTGAPDDPASFDAARLRDATVRELCRRVTVVSDGRHSHADWTTKTIVTCRDGAVHQRTTEEFPGTPVMPLSRSDLERRFHVMSAGRDPGYTRDLFARLCRVEDEASVDWIR